MFFLFRLPSTLSASASLVSADAAQQVQPIIHFSGMGPSTSDTIPTSNSVLRASTSSPSSNSATPARERYGTWPLIYTLPVFPETIQHALNNAQDFSFITEKRSANRTRLVQVLFEDMVTYDWRVKAMHYIIYIARIYRLQGLFCIY